jgi:demethylmenaquinone methyltransferase/2-methoxy-6-polyprenyl-1,4-benzoquinol methylase
MRDKYELVGPICDWPGAFYSGRSIHRRKVAMQGRLRPDGRVPSAGVGHGRDAVHAARLAGGTVADRSASMPTIFLADLDRAGSGVRIRRVHADIMPVGEFGGCCA